jgi:hypothetical protein
MEFVCHFYLSEQTSRAGADGYTVELDSIGKHMLDGALYSLQYDCSK